jgi:hypothetical protein
LRLCRAVPFVAAFAVLGEFFLQQNNLTQVGNKIPLNPILGLFAWN